MANIMDRMQAQTNEFEALNKLIHEYVALPAVVDDDYPEARHHYESALKTFIDALRANNRLTAAASPVPPRTSGEPRFYNE